MAVQRGGRKQAVLIFLWSGFEPNICIGFPTLSIWAKEGKGESCFRLLLPKEDCPGAAGDRGVSRKSTRRSALLLRGQRDLSLAQSGAGGAGTGIRGRTLLILLRGTGFWPPALALVFHLPHALPAAFLPSLLLVLGLPLLHVT